MTRHQNYDINDLPNLHFIRCDVSDDKEVRSAFKELQTSNITITTVINNAGIVRDGL
ncbi:KR domain-containing protein [Lactiplantibacillus pentosus]|uniref:KR domain-containing protein n=1 Tax=Lactiplantibacillus pentosus TaxID=1589 RepID=UPI0035CEC302